jgi:uncharacterized membrane protein YvbJ
MSWIETIRHLPQPQKLKIIWAVSIIVFVLMVIVWVFASKMGKNIPKDTKLFESIGKGIKDVKENYGK